VVEAIVTIELLSLIVLTAVFAGGYGLGYRHGYEQGGKDYERLIR
jgi:hypothetical protein